MTQSQVITAFLSQGCRKARASALAFEGLTLFSYASPIGHLTAPRALALASPDRRSVTTGRHINALHRAALKAGFQVVEAPTS